MLPSWAEHGRDYDRGSGKFVGDPCSKDSPSRWYDAIDSQGRRAPSGLIHPTG